MICKGYYWAQKVLEVVQCMGAQHTNAVLLSLGDTQRIKPYQHYPEKAYYFGDDHWRTYYHSHGSTGDESHEHGHFHFFARESGLDEWSHVVALGMSNMGQPVSLFTTNLWVTDGEWLEASAALKLFSQLEQSRDDELPLNWFKYLLLLYREEILELLFQRDQELDNLFPHDRDQGFLDRSVYYLSMMDLDLEMQLYEQLSVQQGPAAAG